jgi:CRISPR-associated endoribonuclease Cas6
MPQITSLTLVLKPRDPLNTPPQQTTLLGPFLQGALMEHVDSLYAGVLHQLPFNPYSQYCYRQGGGSQGETVVWKVNALTDEAAEHIVQPLQKLESLEVRAARQTFDVERSLTETVQLKTLLDGIYQPGDAKVKLHVVTPCAFKSRGEYVFMPTVRLILQNLLMHYGQVYGNDKESDDETVSYLEQHVKVASYDLRSQYFGNVTADHKKIPAFVGSMTLRLGGPTTAAGLARMLLMFGEYAGLGIKTSMGMGGMRCLPCPGAKPAHGPK